MTDLLQLAERVEQATGADRELDGTIWWATRSPDEIEAHDLTGYVRKCIQREGSAGNALAQFYDSANPACLANLAFQQAYTASLDAALTLVPEGAFYGFVMNGDGDGFAACCQFAGPDEEPPKLLWHSAATPALAMTAACLRARAAR